MKASENDAKWSDIWTCWIKIEHVQGRIVGTTHAFCLFFFPEQLILHQRSSSLQCVTVCYYCCTSSNFCSAERDACVTRSNQSDFCHKTLQKGTRGVILTHLNCLFPSNIYSTVSAMDIFFQHLFILH